MKHLEAFVLLTAVKTRRKDAVVGLMRSSHLKEAISTGDQRGRVPEVARNLAVQQMKGLLNEQVLEDNQRERDQMSFYSWAAQCGHLSLLEILLTEDPRLTYNWQPSDHSSRDHWRGMSLLGLAAFFGHGSVCRVLLANGADLEARDIENRVALHHASSQGHSQVAKLLLNCGAKVGAVATWLKQTSLHMAASNGHGLVCRILLENGADSEARDQVGQTALHDASLRGFDEAVHFLLRGGAKVGAIDEKTDSTALHLAAMGGHCNIVRTLIEQGADVDMPDMFGSTALIGALVEGHEAVSSVLLDSGANPLLKDCFGRDATCWVLKADPHSGVAKFSNRLVSNLFSKAYEFRDDGALPSPLATPFCRAEIILTPGKASTYLCLGSCYAYVELPSDTLSWNIREQHRKNFRIPEFENRVSQETSFKFWIVHQEKTLSFSIEGGGNAELRVLNGGSRTQKCYIQRWEGIGLDPYADIVEPDALIPLPWWSNE